MAHSLSTYTHTHTCTQVTLLEFNYFLPAFVIVVSHFLSLHLPGLSLCLLGLSLRLLGLILHLPGLSRCLLGLLALLKPKRQLKVPESMKENGLLPESNTDRKLIWTILFELEEDLVPGRKVIWTYRKMPYAAEVLKVNGKYKCEKHVHVMRMHSYL